MTFRHPSVYGIRNSRMYWKTSEKLKQKISLFLEEKTFVDSNGKRRKFKSYSEAEEYIWAVLISRGDEGWKMLSQQKLTPVIV